MYGRSYTSDIFRQITDSILLAPSAEYELKRILSRLDGEEIIDDLKDEEEE